MTHFIKLSDKCVGDLVVPPGGLTKSRSAKKVEADVIILESLFLGVVISLNIVADSSLEALLACLSVALGYG